MTVDRIEKIRAEVERRYNYHKEHAYDYASSDHFWKTIEDKEILSFIDSLKEDPKFKVGDRIKPIDGCLCSPRTICEVCDGWYVTNQGTIDFEYEDNWELVEDPVSEDLEHELAQWWNNHYAGIDKSYTFEKFAGHYIENSTLLEIIRHFVDWKKNKCVRTAEAILTLARRDIEEDVKNQIMNDAIDGWFNKEIGAFGYDWRNHNFKEGDKVKIIKNNE